MEFFGDAFSVKAKIQRERLNCVQNELALAFALLDFANLAQQPETRARSIDNARKAYGEVAGLLAAEFDCSQWDRAHLESSLSRLKARLDEERVTPSGSQTTDEPETRPALAMGVKHSDTGKEAI